MKRAAEKVESIRRESNPRVDSFADCRLPTWLRMRVYKLERETGFEPATPVWKTGVLPELHHSRPGEREGGTGLEPVSVTFEA